MQETVIINVDGIEVKTTKFIIEATKIAKRLDISMIFCSNKRIEIAETNKSKARKFVNEISDLGAGTEIVDLRMFNQHLDNKGNDVTKSKALYLTDEEHYKELIGEGLQ